MFSFLKNNHYIWETGLAGHLSWAPLGTKLKRRVEDHLRREFAQYEFEEIETGLIYRREVWERSGHWDRFQDPIVKTQSGKCFRVDKLLEENYPDLDYSTLSEKQVLEYLERLNDKWRKEHHAADPSNKDRSPTTPELAALEPVDIMVIGSSLEYQSLMMRLVSGSQEVGLRPETATATYFHYEDIKEAMCHKWPLKVYQIGRSFRNEIAPKHNLIRGREFTQAEFQMILPEAMKSDMDLVDSAFGKELLETPLSYRDPKKPNIQRQPAGALIPDNPVFACLVVLTFRLFVKLGFSWSKLRLRRHGPDEMAFYALDAWDIEIDLKGLGWTEIAGIHDRGAWDLRHLGSEAEVPHILEVAIGVDRLVYAILDRLYEERTTEEGKTTLRLPYHLSPIQVSVLPLMKNRPELVQRAREIYRILRAAHFTAEYSEKKSIGKRYLENARRGIPWSITIDHQTLDDNTVTVRDRDTEKQVRIAVKQLRGHLLEKIWRSMDEGAERAAKAFKALKDLNAPEVPHDVANEPANDTSVDTGGTAKDITSEVRGPTSH